jgi:hypothetical protein
MRRLFLFPLLLFSVACSDNMPVEPEMDLSPELSVATERGGMGDVVKMVPFKLKGDWGYASEGDATICDEVPGTALIQFIEWEGTATHMGKVTGTNVNCFGPGEPMNRPLLAQGGAITAANGDVLKVFGTEATLTIFSDFSFEIGPVDFVPGGTGRFENVTGWYQLHAEDAINAGPFTLEGEISSVGSSK